MIGGSTGNLALGSSSQQSRSERDLTKVTKVRVRTKDLESPSNKLRTKMKTTTMIVSGDSAGQGQGPVDVVRAPLNWQLAESTALALQQASDNLVQLYKRISLDYELEEGTRREFLQHLATTAGVAQQTLRPVNPHTPASSSSATVTVTGSSVSSQHRR